MSLPISNPTFWKDRIERARRLNKPLYTSVYDVSQAEWDAIQSHHIRLLDKLVYPGSKVLDAGCGYGRILPLLPNSCQYVGVDLSPDFINLASSMYPSGKFLVGDLASLDFKENEFDVALAVSVEGTVRSNLGTDAWRLIETELCRVAKRVILLSYSQPTVYVEIETVTDPEHHTINVIHVQGGYMTYRPGPGNVCEICDIAIEPEYRNRGLGTELHKCLFSRGYNAVYGFSKVNNEPIQALQKKLGFEHVLVPGFYGPLDAVLAYKKFR